jgi:hypothetical protein
MFSNLQILTIALSLPLLWARTCVQDVPGSVKTCSDQSCLKADYTDHTGKHIVVRTCINADISGSVELSFCNDKDMCNDNSNSATVKAGVRAIKCKCDATMSKSINQFWSLISKQPASEGSVAAPLPDICNGFTQCTATGSPPDTVAACVTLSAKLNGQSGSVHACYQLPKILESFPAKGNVYLCNNKDKCNSAATASVTVGLVAILLAALTIA